MAIYANLNIDQGSDFTTELAIEDAAGTGVADLTEYTAKAQIRRSFKSSTYWDFTVNINVPTQGLISMNLPASVSNTMKPGRYLYDVEVTHTGTNDVTRVIEGQLEIIGGITQ